MWLDADNDGLMGPGEQGIDGVTVALYVDAAGDGVPDGGPVDAQVTGQGGLYAFGGLPAGTYVLEVYPPAGMVSSTGAIARLAGPYEPPSPTATAGASDDGDDGRSLSNGVVRSWPVTVGAAPSTVGEPSQPGTAAGDTMAGVPDVWGDATVDFGLFPARSIDDGLWLDENGDGLLSRGEPGPRWRADRAGARRRGAGHDRDRCVRRLRVPEPHPRRLRAAHRRSRRAALDRPPASSRRRGDHRPSRRRRRAVAPDADGDGVPDVIDETPDAAAGPEVVDDTLDALDGTVDGVFNGVVQGADGDPALLAPDDTRSELAATEIAPTAPAPSADTAVEVVPVTVAPDWAGSAADQALQRFGMWAPRSIGHLVWEDADDDGTFDPGEVGIPGIEVRLVRGAEVVATTVSAADGTYRFNDLPDGTYRVVIDVPPTWRTAQVGWDQPAGARSGIDHGSSRRTTGRAVSPPIRIGRLAADDLTRMGSFDHADIGLFQPRPSLTLDASVRGCTAAAATGTVGPRGSCAASGVDEGNPVVASGSELTWVYVVTNTGNTPLHDVTVVDDLAAGGDVVDCNGDRGGDGQPFALEPGRATTCTVRDRVVAGQGHRIATVVAASEAAPGTDVALDPVTATTNWFGTAPGLALTTAVMLSAPGVDTDGDGVLDDAAALPAGPIDAIADADAARRSRHDAGAPRGGRRHAAVVGVRGDEHEHRGAGRGGGGRRGARPRVRRSGARTRRAPVVRGDERRVGSRQCDQDVGDRDRDRCERSDRTGTRGTHQRHGGGARGTTGAAGRRFGRRRRPRRCPPRSRHPAAQARRRRR